MTLSMSKTVTKVRRDVARNKYSYVMLTPVVLYYLVFHYWPMWGAQIAFRSYYPGIDILDADWVGFRHFASFFRSFYFWRLIRNTLLINVYDVLFHFPAPILFALLLNEVRTNSFKRVVQSITYLPHFISIVVVAGLMHDFLAKQGLINDFVAFIGFDRINFLGDPGWFRTIYISSNVWQGLGWGSIIYLAALSRIDPELYEAAIIDGAGRLRQAIHITLPGIMPIIVIMLILRFGRMLSVGSEKVLLLYNPVTYETADVISTFVYRRGLLEADYSYSAAVGLFNSLVNFILLVAVNRLNRGIGETSLW